LRAGSISSRFNLYGGFRKGERVDFDTGSRPEPAGSGGSGRGTDGRPPGTSASAGGDFDYKDPVQSFLSTAREVLVRPSTFFRSIRRQGDFVNPLLFAVICTVISAVLSGVLGFLFALVLGNQGVGGALVGLFTGIILSPILSVVALFIGAGIWHLLVMLLVRPSNAGFEATFRVAAYLSAIQLVTWVVAIPILGWIVALVAAIYGLYVAYFGIREVHSASNQRAAAVVAIPVLAAIVFAFVFGVLLAALFSIGQQQF
jgi:hypothetical protein